MHSSKARLSQFKAMEPQLDEELAWDTGWTCPSCTLVNESEAPRCGACNSLRSSVRNSGVVVVLPPDRKQKRPEGDDQWACPACTLLNDEAEDRCGACGSQRWLSKRPKTAAAVRAARRDLSSLSRNTQKDTSGGGTDGTLADSMRAEDHGIWGGLGPDREFLPLPPAPELRVVYRSAKDTEVDIFAELGESTDKTDAPPETAEGEQPKKLAGGEVGEEGGEGTTGKNAKGGEGGGESAALGPALPSNPSLSRPAWRIQGAPIFAGDPSLESLPCLELGLSEATVFEDAVGRLALSGFEVTKRLVLERSV